MPKIYFQTSYMWKHGSSGAVLLHKTIMRHAILLIKHKSVTIKIIKLIVLSLFQIYLLEGTHSLRITTINKMSMAFSAWFSSPVNLFAYKMRWCWILVLVNKTTWNIVLLLKMLKKLIPNFVTVDTKRCTICSVFQCTNACISAQVKVIVSSGHICLPFYFILFAFSFFFVF